jgi:predicted TIM-barrel fold metal-dependent hydrolase
VRAIDAWVNVQMPSVPAPWQEQVAQELFKRPAKEVFRNFSVEEMLEAMDRLGVEKAIVALRAEAPSPMVLRFADRRPDRFALAAYVDPRRGLRAVRQLESVFKQHPVVIAQVIPCMIDLPPDDRVCYPLYAKCVELGLPVSVNTGIPGPPLPARFQDPLFLDAVCLFFPELVVVMANGADPWWGTAIRLMSKYPNLHLMTSAYSPRRLPAELIRYMAGRGRDKILFATDFPFLTMERCLEEARALELDEQALDQYLYENARRVLLSRQTPAAPVE